MKAVKGGIFGTVSDCIFYDSNYQTPIDAKDVVYNQTIYWVTSEYGVKYHHQGTIGEIASKKSMS